MRLQIKLVMALVTISGFASQSFAAVSGVNPVECESEGDSVLCVSLPSQAPESFPLPKAATTSETVTLVTANETSGQALEFTEIAMGQPSAQLPAAQLAAMKAQDSLRSIELFLKSGIGSTGDLRVITTGKVPVEN